jgi:hypothetical protein
VAGRGLFDPDGAGPLAAYRRLWVTQAGLGGTWTNAAGGTWGRGPNWSTGTPAMQVGDATFDLDAAYTITLDRDELTETISVEAGTVTIDFAGQALSTESGMTIAKGATLKGNGTIVSDVLNSGTVAVGNGPAVLTVHGNLISAGTLEMGIAGLMSHDVVHVTGEFTAGGTIAVELMEDYAPLLGDTFNLMSFDSFIDGGYTFDFSEAELSPGLAWDTSGFAATGTVSVVPEPISCLPAPRARRGGAAGARTDFVSSDRSTHGCCTTGRRSEKYRGSILIQRNSPEHAQMRFPRCFAGD